MSTDNDREFEEVFEQVEADRKSGKLKREVLKNGGYSITKKHPDHISKFNSKGELVAIGHYIDGGFAPSEIFIEE